MCCNSSHEVLEVLIDIEDPATDRPGPGAPCREGELTNFPYLPHAPTRTIKDHGAGQKDPRTNKAINPEPPPHIQLWGATVEMGLFKTYVFELVRCGYRGDCTDSSGLSFPSTAKKRPKIKHHSYTPTCLPFPKTPAQYDRTEIHDTIGNQKLSSHTKNPVPRPSRLVGARLPAAHTVQ